MSSLTLMPGHVVHVDLIPHLLKYVWGIQHHVYICDEFSTYFIICIQSMKSISNSDVTAFNTMIKQMLSVSELTRFLEAEKPHRPLSSAFQV